MHRVLTRQLKRLGLTPEVPPTDPAVWQALLERISRTYGNADQDRYLLERSLSLSSKEMQDLYQSLQERTQAELDKLRAVLGSLGAGLCLLTPDGTVVSLNPEAERLLGYEAGTLEGTRLTSLVLPEGHVASLEQHLAVGEPDCVEDGLFLRKDGTPLPVSYTLNPIVEAGLFRGGVLVFFDITDRKQDKERLKRSLSLVQSTLESTADGILVVDAGGRIVDHNEKFVQMWRIPPEVLATHDDEQAIGFVLDQLADPDAFLDGVKALYANPEKESHDVLYFRDGRVFERYSQPQKIGSDIVGRVWSFRDITERRRAEEALRDHATELERAKASLEAQAGQLAAMIRDLEAAKEHAEESARFKATILNNMSHEIRTPITSILGYAQILSEELDAEHAEFIDYIRGNGKRLLHTLNAILDLSRLDAGSARLHLHPVDLVEVSLSSIAMLKPMAMQKKLTLRFEGPTTPVEALLDETALHRILHNLIGNAIKFTDAGEVVVEAEPAGERVFLRVRDTGIGIGEDFLPHVFEEFKQESSGLDRSHEGSGLGLAITRRLVQAMEGTIAVESTSGAGTCFTLTFPALTPAPCPSPGSGVLTRAPF